MRRPIAISVMLAFLLAPLGIVGAQDPTSTPVTSNGGVRSAPMTGRVAVQCGEIKDWDAAGAVLTEFLDEAAAVMDAEPDALQSTLDRLIELNETFVASGGGACLQGTGVTIDDGMDALVRAVRFQLRESAAALARFDQATVRFFLADRELRAVGVTSDPRLSDTSVIWGGQSTKTIFEGEAQEIAGCSFEEGSNWLENMVPTITVLSSVDFEADADESLALIATARQEFLDVDFPTCLLTSRFYITASLDLIARAVQANVSADTDALSEEMESMEEYLIILNDNLNEFEFED